MTEDRATAGRPAWAVRLEVVREAREWNKRQMARHLLRVAGYEVTAAAVASVARQIRGWERGDHFPRDWTGHYATALEMDEAELFGATGDDTSAALEPATMPLVGLAAGAEVLQALEAIGGGQPATITDGLGELIDHYAQTIAALPPAATYGELVAVRAYATTALDRFGGTRWRADLTLATGWLSTLLAIAAQDMGQHAAARLWCLDAERRSEQAQHPELSGWALLTRAMIAHYLKLPVKSAELAARGQQVTAFGRVAHAKLAAQEMRAVAEADPTDLARARQHATAAIAALPADAPASGVFSLPAAEDPPYTATSLLLTGRHREAIAATQRVVETVYDRESRQRGDNPSGYARSLLILGLAHAGVGDLDEATGNGLAALAGSRTAWPTVALAGQLDQALADAFPRARPVVDYHARYLEVANSMEDTDDG